MSDASPPPAGRSPFNIWWALSGGLLLLVIIAAVAFGVSSLLPQGDDPDSAPAPSDTSSAAPSSPAAPVGETCDLDASDQSIPVVGPEAEWETFGYFLYPTSDVYGPTEDPAGSEWACFTHNPTGALFAAANFFKGMSGPDYGSVLEDGAIQNAAADAWLAAQTPETHEQTPGRVAQITGYQFTEVEGDRVTVRLLFGQEDLDAYMTFTMVWDPSRQTWLADFSANTPAWSEAASTESFTEWTAVG